MSSPQNAEVITIQGVGPKGDGIHQSPHGRIYVDRALPDETVRAQIQRGAGGVLRGEVVEIVTSSPHRVAAPCPNYATCGGCTLQHADDAFYRNWKVAIVRDALAREGLTAKTWREPVFVPAGTRRRVTFAATKRGNRVTLGYFRRRTHHVTEITSCLVADPTIMEVRAKLAISLAPILQDGKTVDVFLQAVNGQCEAVITGLVGKTGRPDLHVHEALAAVAHQSKLGRVSWRRGEHDEPEVMLEIAPMRAKFGVLDVALAPLAFLQPTKAGEGALVEAVMAGLPSSGKLADLFAGCGTFSGPMLTRGSVDAFENEEAAVRALTKAGGAKPIKAATRDLFRDPLTVDELARYDAIVFDPPRVGALAQARILAECKSPRLVGVSCNPATFARDARVLVDGGYRLESVAVVDQFTWSHHVELVAAFARS